MTKKEPLTIDSLLGMVSALNTSLATLAESVGQAANFATTAVVVDDSTVAVMSTLDCVSGVDGPCQITTTMATTASVTHARQLLSPLWQPFVLVQLMLERLSESGTINRD